MRHLIRKSAQESAMAQQAKVAAVRGDLRIDRLHARRDAWSPCYRPSDRRHTGSLAMALTRPTQLHLRQPVTAGGLGTPRNTRFGLAGVVAGPASSCRVASK